MIYSQQHLLYFYANAYSLNKTQLAADLGISRPTLDKYLSGSAPLPLIYKKYIALDFDLPAQFLDFKFQLSKPICPLTKQRLYDLPF